MKKKMPPKAYFFFLIVSLLTGQSWGETLSLRFTTSDWKASGDLQINQSQETIEALQAVIDWNDGSGNNTSSFEFGDGRHGSFDITTYSNFSENGDVSGQVIRVNTDTYPALYFTDFNLAAGWELRPTGSNALILYSQKDVVISGTVNCSGENGADAMDDENSVPTIASGRCSGGDGGQGGYYNGTQVDAGSGVDGGSNTTAGGAGLSDATTGGKGGGGGGAYNTSSSPTSGKNPDTAGDIGNQGTSFADNPFTILSGGSGGGGGSSFLLGNATENSSGASGGAGGGVVLIRAYGDVTVNSGGAIYALGGDGGSSDSGRLSGAGGGGGGGSINIFTTGDIRNFGNIDALAGAAGSADGGGHGGTGGIGRNWLVEKDGAAGGSTFESPSDLFLDRGTTGYYIGSFELVSKTFDFENSAPEITAVDFLGNIDSGNSYSIEFASSDLESFTPVWKSIASLTTEDQKRYWKFRLSLNQANTLASSLSGIDISYNPSLETNFDFVAGCGAINIKEDFGNSLKVVMLLLLLLPVLLSLSLKISLRKQIAS